MRPGLLLIALLAIAHLSACSSQQLYNTGQAWQRNECHKLVDAQDRNRCLAGADMPYEDYKRQTQAVDAPK